MGTRYITQDSPANLEFAGWLWEQIVHVPFEGQVDMMRFLYGQGQ